MSLTETHTDPRTAPALPGTLRLGAPQADLGSAAFVSAGVTAEPVEGGFLVRDPWQTAVVFVATAATGLRSRRRR